MKKIPSFAGCHLTAHPKIRVMWKQVNQSAGTPSACPESSFYQSGLCSEEVALRVGLDSEHQSSSYIHSSSGWNFLKSTRSKNLVMNPGSVFKMLCFSKLFVVSSNFLG